MYLYITDQNQIATKKPTESAVLQQFYEDLQNCIPIDEFLPQLVTTKIITITDKMSITDCSKRVNERCQYFLDHYISKPLSAGNPSSFHKMLQIMDASPRCSGLADKIKQSLKTESMQDNQSGMHIPNCRDKSFMCFTCIIKYGST